MTGSDKTVSMKFGSRWIWCEAVLALSLYMKHRKVLPLGDKEVRELATLMGRTESSVILKLANFRAVESNGVSGMTHFTPLDKQVWQKFSRNEDLMRRETERCRRELSESG